MGGQRPRIWSPSRWVRGVQRLARGGGAPPTQGGPYVRALLAEFHRFIERQYGARALPRDKFEEIFWRHQASGIVRPANRFIGDLWYLFAPDFTERLGEYYQAQELQLTMTFLGYAAAESLLQDNYLAPYRMMRERLPRAAVLEVGAGLPHGFLATVLDHGGDWCDELAIVEVDALYARFVRWFCESRGIRFRHEVAEAARAPRLPAERHYDFVFAKDVFEHLDDPRRTVAEIVARAAPTAILALDLEDKGPVEYQHISPELSALKPAVTSAGFRLLALTGNISVYERTS
jgi:SAM-dependent methyltransferase